MRLSSLVCALMLAACSPAIAPVQSYLGVETRLLEGDLVQFRVAMTGEASRETLSDYAHCAAAQYALIRDFGFARLVRVTFSEEGGNRQADAVYSVSEALPPGVAPMDAEVVTQDCRARGVPTV